MFKQRLRLCTAICGSLAAIAMASPTLAQTAATAPSQGAPPLAAAAPSEGVAEIIVTAQKREQSINSVGQSITAVTGDALVQRGITNTSDLAKVVPGFSFAPSPFQEPVYVLRGVGLYDSGLGSSPAVTVYLDQVPLPFPIMTEVAPLDLQRVEALKGPQGTLFGQNSTGGAINYIAAKPTNTLEAGTDLTYGRFNAAQATGFISGPLTDTVNARLSVGTSQGGAYQYSVERPGAKIGDADQDQARLLVDWRPNDRLKFELNLNGFYNGSDTQIFQLSAVTPGKPALASPALLAAPIIGDNPRAANWPAGFPFRSNDSFYQGSLRTDYQFNSDLSLTALTSYEHSHEDKLVELSGLDVPGAFNNLHTLGDIRAFGQEVRLNGHTGPATWTVGGNYDYAGITDGETAELSDTADQPIPTLPPFHYSEGVQRQSSNDYALFGNLDYKLPDNFTAHLGIRGTEADRRSSFCNFDPTAGDALGNITTALETLFARAGLKTTPVIPVASGQCASLTPAPQLDPSRVHEHLNEQNLSWKAGLDYKFNNGTLLYLSDSVGYKSGIISPVLASSTSQLTPVKQERLNAIEMGVKAPLFNRLAQLNLAGFYYAYDDQQLRTRLTDPVFGSLQQLVNIPRSQLWGLDGDLQAHPFHGLTLSVSGTYIVSDVTENFVAQNAAGVTGDLKGSSLPFTPKVQIVADGQYDWSLSETLKAFIGSSLTYHSASNATFATLSAPAPLFKLPDYTVLDFRGGLASQDGRWRLTGFVRNATNEYYLLTVMSSTDSVSRAAGLPLEFGATLSLRFH